MSIFLSNDVNYHDQPVTQSQTMNETEHVNPSSSNASDTNLGQVIRGEVISIDKNNVQIALANHEVISAKVDSCIHLILNSSLEFSVDRSNPAQILLHPIQNNSQTNPTITNALNMAGLPVNDRTSALVNSMMKQGMSIDRNTLNTVYRESLEYSGIQTDDLLALHKLNIPVNQETVNQLQNCLNMNQQLMGGIQECTDALLNLCNQLSADGKEGTVIQLLTELIQNFEESFNAQNMDSSSTISNLETLNAEILTTDTSAPNTLTPDTSASETLASDTSAPEGLAPENLAVDISKTETLASDASATESLKPESLASAKLSPEISGADGKELEELKQLLQNLQNTGHSDDVEKVVHHIQRFLQQKWSIDPQKMIQNENSSMGKQLDRIYESILEETGRMKKTADQLVNPDNHFSRTTEQLKSNIDFLHYMNQTYQYVQIPLKMSNRYQNSELYVYTNKKNLAQKKDNLSAVLHLDMDNLGPVDVYVNLSDSKVSTRFLLADEDAIRLVESHIQMLNDRLNQKGFTVSSEVSMKEQDNQDLAKQKKEPDKEQSLYQYSFDVKA